MKIPMNIKEALMRAEPGQVVYNTPVGAVMATEQSIPCSSCAFYRYNCGYDTFSICSPNLIRRHNIGGFISVDKTLE